MAVIIGVLMAVILLLAVAIYLIVSRHRQRKCFASPLASKPALPGSNNHQHLPPGSGCGTAEKGTTMGSYSIKEVDDNYNQSTRCGGGVLPGVGTMASTTMSTLPPPPGADKTSSMLLMDHVIDIKLDDYQEPYQALKYAPYYSYSTVVMEMKDMLNKCSATQSGQCPYVSFLFCLIYSRLLFIRWRRWWSCGKARSQQEINVIGSSTLYSAH